MKLSMLFLTAIVAVTFPFTHAASAAEIKIPLPKFKPAAEVTRVENVVTMEPIVDSDESPVSIEEVTENIIGSSQEKYFSKVDIKENDLSPLPTPPVLSEQARRDIECLTEAIYFESVGEPVAGQIAVANVIMNRANWNVNEREPHERHRVEFSGGICDVVAFKISRTYSKPVIVKTNKKKEKKKKWVQKTYTTCAFSYRCERGFHAKLQRVKQKERWNEIKALAKETYIRYNSGENVDPSHGATFYHATWMKRWPWWSKQYEKTKVIGLHVFYKIP